jgi:hypothetical protein
MVARGPDRGVEHERVERVSDVIGAKDVEALVAQKSGDAGDRVEDLLDIGGDSCPAPAGVPAAGCGVGRRE